MKINVNKISFFQAILILVKAGTLLETVMDKNNGGNLGTRIKDEAYYTCSSAMEDKP